MRSLITSPESAKLRLMHFKPTVYPAVSPETTDEGSASARRKYCLCTAGGVEEVEANQDVPSIEETARLFIRNLPYGATEADLAEAFREHGEISEVHLVLDRYHYERT